MPKQGVNKVDLNKYIKCIVNEKKTRMEAYIIATNQLQFMYLTTKKYTDLTKTEHNKYHSLSSMGNMYYKKNQKMLDELLGISIEQDQDKAINKIRESYEVNKDVITKMIFEIHDDKEAKNSDKIKCIELLIKINENQILDKNEVDNIQSIYNFNINTKKDENK